MSAAAEIAEPSVGQLAAKLDELTSIIRDQAATIARLATPKPSITIAALFARYTLVRQQDERNWPRIRRRLEPLVRRLGELPAADLKPVVWAEHRNARAQEPDYRGGLPRPALLNRELERTKEMLRWALDNELLDRNPLASAKATRAPIGRETWLEDKDVEQLLAACSRVRDGRGPCFPGYREYRPLILRAFVLACVDSGLRKNEARLLRRDRIGRDGVVELLARQTKSRRKRIVALTPRTLEAINAIPTEWKHVPTSCKSPIVTGSRAPFVFINPRTGDLLCDRTLWEWFRKAVEFAGLDARCAAGDRRLRVHDLRHTFASLADAKGASATAIKDALGHTNLGITQRYLHRDQMTGAVALARLMDPAKGGK